MEAPHPTRPAGITGIADASRRGSPGFFHLGQTAAGYWWLIDPSGQPVFPAAVEGVNGPPAPAPRLRSWGFTAVATESPAGGVPVGAAWLPSAGLGRCGPGLHAAGIGLPDVFDPEWAAAARGRALRTAGEAADDSRVLGWRPDDALDWAWSQPEGRPTLLQRCLSLEPRHAAYHAAWEFVLALHGGSFEHLAAAWDTDLPNREVLRRLTLEEKGIASAGYLSDHRRWSEEYARRYLRITRDCLREAAPHHLLFSPSAGRLPDPPWWGSLAAGLTDVRTATWTPSAFTGAPAAGDGPLWLTGYTWADERVHGPEPEDDEPPALTRVERMLHRGRSQLRALAVHPAVVGWSWAGWTADEAPEPVFAPALLGAGGRESVVHTEALRWVNARAPGWRAGAARETPAG